MPNILILAYIKQKEVVENKPCQHFHMFTWDTAYVRNADHDPSKGSHVSLYFYWFCIEKCPCFSLCGTQSTQDTDEIGLWGEPIWVNTLSSHCSGPLRWISIQHGVLVTSCRWYSAPQPLTKLMRMVHILVSSYTASNPWLTDWLNRDANSWLLKIFKLQPGGILHTVVGWKPWW